MFRNREAATLLAALQYWREEMVPHGRAIMQPYFHDLKLDHLTPLNKREIAKLSERLNRLARATND